MIRSNRPKGKPIKYGPGYQFGCLTVLDRMDNRFYVICECGNETSFHMSNLLQTQKADCGCGIANKAYGIDPEKGMIYIVKAEPIRHELHSQRGVCQYAKIGWSKNGAARRLPALQTGCPLELTLAREVGPACKAHEYWAKDYFSLVNHRDEWFYMVDEMLTVEFPEIGGFKPQDLVFGMPSTLSLGDDL